LSLTSSSGTLTSATTNIRSASSSLAAASSRTRASTPATASSSALAHTLTHAGMGLYGWGGDLRKLSSLKFFHNISDASATLVLINIDIGG